MRSVQDSALLLRLVSSSVTPATVFGLYWQIAHSRVLDAASLQKPQKVTAYLGRIRPAR